MDEQKLSKCSLCKRTISKTDDIFHLDPERVVYKSSLDIPHTICGFCFGVTPSWSRNHWLDIEKKLREQKRFTFWLRLGFIIFVGVFWVVCEVFWYVNVFPFYCLCGFFYFIWRGHSKISQFFSPIIRKSSIWGNRINERFRKTRSRRTIYQFCSSNLLVLIDILIMIIYIRFSWELIEPLFY